jgi:hypothetical protein
MFRHIHLVKKCRFRLGGVPKRLAAYSHDVYLFLNQGYTVAANWRCWASGPRVEVCCWSDACFTPWDSISFSRSHGRNA